jgi:hypothetical protein
MLGKNQIDNIQLLCIREASMHSSLFYIEGRGGKKPEGNEYIILEQII